MQRLATPRFLPCLRSAPSSVTRMRAPEAPIGWPSAQAPPCTLTLSCGMPCSFIAAIVTTAKASLISKRSTSFVVQPVFSVQLLDRADRRRREQARLLRMRRVADDHRERREPSLLGGRAAHQHQRRRAVGDRARVRRGHRAVLAKRRLQRRDLVGRRLGGLLVLVDHDVALATRHRDRRRSPTRTCRRCWRRARARAT